MLIQTKMFLLLIKASFILLSNNFLQNLLG